MPRTTAAPNPEVVNLLERATRKCETGVFDWLTADEKAAHERTVREVAGAFVVSENRGSGKRTANVRILGLPEKPTRADFDLILSTASDEGAQTIRVHLLKSSANAPVVDWLREVGFRPKQGLVHWMTPAHTRTNATEGHDIRQIGPAEAPEFARIVGINYHYKSQDRVAALIHEMSAPNVASFLAYVDGVAVGTGLVHHFGSLCDLGYGTTLRAYRGRGIQQAIIAARVQYAKSTGCEWATACTMGFDRSSRNLVRQGFRKAYIMSDYERTE